MIRIKRKTFLEKLFEIRWRKKDLTALEKFVTSDGLETRGLTENHEAVAIINQFREKNLSDLDLEAEVKRPNP